MLNAPRRVSIVRSVSRYVAAAAACAVVWSCCGLACSATTDRGAADASVADSGRRAPSDAARDSTSASRGDSAADARVDSARDAPVQLPEAGTDAGVDADATPDVFDAGFDAGFDSGCVPVYLDASTGGSWQPLTHPPGFDGGPSASPTATVLLTDGTVIVGLTWRLTPDSSGSYVNGSWSQIAPLPAGYSPIDFASAVLPDGRLLVEGGEYNQGAKDETTLGAIYDPVADVWQSVAPPAGWYVIGDAPSVILPNGQFMVSGDSMAVDPLGLASAALLTGWTDAGAVWTLTGPIDEGEEGWTLLPSGQVLTVDTFNGTESELYVPDAGIWVLAGDTTTPLVDAAHEIGPQLLLPNGSVFVAGATGHTAIYSAAGAWSAGPDMPVTTCGQLGVSDGPGVLLPNGHVLLASSPILPGLLDGEQSAYPPTYFLEFDGTSIAEVAHPPAAPLDLCSQIVLLLLPTGQVLEVDGSADVEVYTPVGGPDPAWGPSISTAPPTVARGTTYPITGTQFNGLSQAVAYGDDYQAATNFPLVRITNNATGHVFYARTHDHSTMGVATGSQQVSTSFDVPIGADTGPSTIAVVANGIASPVVAITVE